MMGLPPSIVIDTNWVLDLWVFQGPDSQALRAAIEAGAVRWLVTPAMRVELERVLMYPAILKKRQQTALSVQDVLDQMDRYAVWVATAARAPVRCKDPDDQIFIDLALEHQATLLSKDKAVLSCRKRLRVRGVPVQATWALALL